MMVIVPALIAAALAVAIQTATGADPILVGVLVGGVVGLLGLAAS